MSDNLIVPIPKTVYVKTGDFASQMKEGYSSFSKLTLALSALVAGSLCAYYSFAGPDRERPGTTDGQLSSFVDYLAKYGKAYQEPEFSERFAIYKQNAKLVSEHDPFTAGFSLELNRFADMEEHEILRYSGAIVPPERSEEMAGFSFKKHGRRLSEEPLPEIDVSYLPKSVNWYKKGAVSRPQSQGGCGGCWAFSTAAALESMAYLSGHSDTLPNYSVQQLIDCDKVNIGCAGGWMFEGFQYVNKYGILHQDHYRQVNQRQNKCEVTEEHVQSNAALSKIGYIEKDGRTNEELKLLLQEQPISIGMKTTSPLHLYHGGIMTEEYLKCSHPRWEVNHGVLLVGYGSVDDDCGADHELKYGGKCKNYWIIRNSWGPDWGEEGFFKLCADGLGSAETPLGTCLVNKYAVWPTMNPDDIEEDEEPSLNSEIES